MGVFGRKKRWDPSKYHPDYFERAPEVRAIGYCEHCGAENGDPRISHAGNDYKVIISACHLYPNQEHLPNAPLIALCQTCHFKHDAPFRHLMAEGNHERRLHEILLEQEGYGEVEAPGEGEYDHFSSWVDPMPEFLKR